MIKKVCTKCNECKDINEFSFDSKSKGYRKPHCRSCRKKEDAEYRRINRSTIRIKDKLRDRKEYRRNQYKKNKHRILSNPMYKLRNNFGRQIRTSLKGGKNGLGWETILGYTLNDLKNHLESLFRDGISWNNYGEWHIDHCIPISWFENNWAGVIKAFELVNLQPVWAKYNLSKGNRWADLSPTEQNNGGKIYDRKRIYQQLDM
jgi:hypothetical protein